VYAVCFWWWGIGDLAVTCVKSRELLFIDFGKV
jgi:hypothetical protein